MEKLSFFTAKHNWFVDKINYLKVQKGVTYSKIAESLGIFLPRLSSMCNNEYSIIKDTYIDILIKTYDFQNPIYKYGSSFTSAKRTWFLEKLDFLKRKKQLSQTDISKALGIFPSRLSVIVNDRNSIINDNLIDILIEKYDLENPFDTDKTLNRKKQVAESDSKIEEPIKSDKEIKQEQDFSIEKNKQSEKLTDTSISAQVLLDRLLLLEQENVLLKNKMYDYEKIKSRNEYLEDKLLKFRELLSE